MSRVAIIIPIYKESLTYYEKIAVEQCFKVLIGYPIIMIKPYSINFANANMFSNVISFEDSFFSDIHGYNKLMLHPDFYKAFLNYEFILIYQLDAFVFKNDLEFWCNQKIDYVGAPWLRPSEYPDIIKATKSRLLNYFHIRYNIKQPKRDIPTEIQFENKVGNGGLSLRRVKRLYELCLENAPLIDEYNKRQEHYFNEDTFWSIEVNRKHQQLLIPSYKIAVKFAFENCPERALNLNHGELPFGCHAWEKHLEFWRPIFKDHGYNI